MGAENPVTSRDLQILVDEAAEPISAQWPDCRAGAWGRVASGRALVECSVRAVTVVVVDVVLQHLRDVAGSAVPGSLRSATTGTREWPAGVRAPCGRG